MGYNFGMGGGLGARLDGGGIVFPVAKECSRIDHSSQDIL